MSDRPGESDRRAARRRSNRWIVAAGGLVAAAAWILFRPVPEGAVAIAVLEASIRTEPAGAAVRAEGARVVAGRVTFPARPPHGRVEASSGCRVAAHDLGPGDAGREIVLVLDPSRVTVSPDIAVRGATIEVNGRAAGGAGGPIDIDLCRDTVIEAWAPGYRRARVTVAAGATPATARRAVAALVLEALEEGRLTVPTGRATLEVFVDGKRVRRRSGEITLLEGVHEVRAVDRAAWIDVRARVEVHPGRTVSAGIVLPELGRLVVQAFPPNARASLRRAGGSAWELLGDVPLEREIAAGRYDLLVEYVPTGERRETAVDLRPGTNPPVRVAFGGAS